MDTVVNVSIVLASLYFIFNYFINQKEKTKLKKIFIYPLKSAKGIEVKNWKINSNGLEYDREWIIITKKETWLKPRKNTKITMIQTEITEENLILSFEGIDEKLNISLDEFPKRKSSIKMFDQYIDGLIYDDKVINRWLSFVLGEECYLMRKDPNREREILKSNDNEVSTCGFSNYSSFMILSQQSMEELLMRWKGANFDDCHVRFRPNFVFSGYFDPFSEDEWGSIKIGKLEIKSIGKCDRSMHINIDPKTGLESKEPMKTLSSFRKSESDGKTYFGDLFVHNNYKNNISISIDDKISIEEKTFEKSKDE